MVPEKWFDVLLATFTYHENRMIHKEDVYLNQLTGSRENKKPGLLGRRIHPDMG